MKKQGERRKTKGESMEEQGGRLRGKGLPSSFLLPPSSFRLPPFSFLLLAAAVLLPACGFQLRGTATMPFESIYVQPGPAPQIAIQIKRAMAAGSRTRIADKPEDAQVVLHITNELREKQILSLSGGGRVREFELRYRLAYRLTDSKAAKEYIAPSEIVLRRDFSYNDQEALAKESEEALLYRDMQSDAVQQLVRRLQTAKVADKS